MNASQSENVMAIQEAARLAYDLTLSPARWQSILINKRKPHTYRAFFNQGDMRICLHRFDACEPADSFAHPHPWPSSMLVLAGTYEMNVSYSPDLISDAHESVIDLSLGAGSIYHMLERRTWHQVIPRTRCYSLMVNGPRWQDAHRRAPSTKGKGLNPMSEDQLVAHLSHCRELLAQHI